MRCMNVASHMSVTYVQSCENTMYDLIYKLGLEVMVLSATFNNISAISYIAVSFIGVAHRSTRRKPLACRKSLTNVTKNVAWSTPRQDRDSN